MDFAKFIKQGEAAVVSFNVYSAAQLQDLVAGAADHICYKCSSSEEYEKIRSWFEEEGVFIYQTEISGRRIATIKLKQPFLTGWGPIEYLELSDQKPDGSQKSCWDHIEIRTWYYDRTVNEVKQAGIDVMHKIRPHHATHEIALPNGFKFVFTNNMLVDKIISEMK